jgi:hypothetical protein
MTTTCSVHESGAIELYFYGELDAVERAGVADHMRSCPACAEMLRELKMIRVALAERPDVSAPPSGDWSAFMGRLDATLRHDAPAGQVLAFPTATATTASTARRSPRRYAGLLATAALLAIVSLSVFVASRAGRMVVAPSVGQQGSSEPAGARVTGEAPIREGLATVGVRHLERSKLVVLGLATKDVDAATPSDWEYERELATGLLNDTRLYRQAAEQRGLNSLASVMKDLELVLLQASMAEGTDRRALPQIQRLIQKRGLVQKMDVVVTTGLVP